MIVYYYMTEHHMKNYQIITLKLNNVVLLKVKSGNNLSKQQKVIDRSAVCAIPLVKVCKCQKITTKGWFESMKNLN